MSGYLILGCGYTGSRVARALAARGEKVWATTRDATLLSLAGVRILPMDVNDPGSVASAARGLPSGLRVLHSIPLVRVGEAWEDPTGPLLDVFAPLAQRMVYLSTTGIYGARAEVNEQTAAAPRTPRERLRLEAEDQVCARVASALVLRPAAIYGPGRGVHASIRSGAFRLLDDGSNFVSRIHVDDLAALTVKGLDREIQGRYPVADEHPCSSFEIASFCSRWLGVPMPGSAPREELSETRRNDRRVNGTAICTLLGHSLAYPSYRVGIPAAIREERFPS